MEHVRTVAQVPLPPGVREVIRTRLSQHSKEEGALLLAAAVLGRTCTFERLCKVADLSETDALEALEVLLDGRLLTERPSDRRPYTLAHDYIREVVYSESREARRRVFHRRALLALEAAGGTAAECAFHALAALLDEPAFRYSVAAGSEAFATYATHEALTHFDKALATARRMQDRGESVEGELLSRLYRQRGQILELLQNDKAAEANYEEMLDVAVHHRNQAMELAALISQSTLYGNYTEVFNPAKAREAGLQALAKARELGDQEAEAGALWALTVTEFFSAGDNNMIMAYGLQGLALARELGLKELVGGTLNILCWPFVGEKQLGQARAALTEAQDIWRELGNLQRLGETYRFMLIIHFAAGDLHRLLNEATELVDLSVVTGSRLDQLNGLVWLAHAHSLQGHFRQAQGYLDQSGVLTAAIGYSNEAQGYAIGRIKFFLAVGALAEAESWADRLYAQRETIMPTLTHYYLTIVALAKIACGKLDEGQAILDDRLAGLQADAPEFNIITLIAIAYGHLHLAQGRPEALFAGLEEQVWQYREAGFLSFLADEYWLRGRTEMALGNYEAAREALLKARDAAEAQEEQAVLWQILVSLAEVEEACGDVETAERLRDEAREVVGYIVEHAGELRERFLERPEVVSLLNEF
jgi:tetratricopeptide (TPR) repeat protein